MLISTENEQISLVSVSAKESFQTSHMESNPDSIDGLPPVSYFSDSPPLPIICTDVTVIPEHEKNELQQSISNLEGKVFEFQFQVSDQATVLVQSVDMILGPIGFVGEISQLKLRQRLWDEKRREALNKIIDIKGCVVNHNFTCNAFMFHCIK